MTHNTLLDTETFCNSESIATSSMQKNVLLFPIV